MAYGIRQGSYLRCQNGANESEVNGPGEPGEMDTRTPGSTRPINNASGVISGTGLRHRRRNSRGARAPGPGVGPLMEEIRIISTHRVEINATSREPQFRLRNSIGLVDRQEGVHGRVTPRLAAR